ncbi:HDL173Cp [Eremothecium sinecaudum]|uniref:HDL173Cp n=1 Tax=Eremothecium sinecaudum TaxID=45286 RepID=A0A0X8HSC8_9SACH|nr:HDL173Cp [Eremothecium sinecaudum]AMD20571.1 HDL173Cp [Eremothecium sinecaudum]
MEKFASNTFSANNSQELWDEQQSRNGHIGRHNDNQNDIGCSQYLSEEERSKYKHQYTAPKISSHYISTVANTRYKEAPGAKRIRNEAKLKKYYRLKNVSIYPSGTTFSTSDSVGDAPTGSQLSSDIEGSFMPRKSVGLEQRQRQQVPHWAQKGEDSGRFDIFDNFENEGQPDVLESMMSYLNYHDKLSTVVRDTDYQFSRNMMWVPKVDDVRKDGSKSAESDLVQRLYRAEHQSTDESPPGEATTENSSTEDISNQNLFCGTAVNIPIFGDTKLPCLVYHSVVELKNIMYLFGGLQPCYQSNEEAPNLDDFHVDGIENIPPPINPAFLNNPAMIANKSLYVFSCNRFTLKRPKLSGQIPPPLLCAKTTKLTDRYLFHYGGFEIWNDTIIEEETGQYYLKRRLFPNSAAYILDTQVFKFVKIELVSQQTRFLTLRPTIARFGHAQVSLKLNSTNGAAKTGENDEGKSSASSIKTGTASYFSSTDDSLHGQGSDNGQNKSSNSANSQIFTVILMGGYGQTNDNTFQALNDLWKIDLCVVSRGKRGYFKFADTAIATLIAKPSDPDKKWPAARGFMAACISETKPMSNIPLIEGLLQEIKEISNLEPAQSENESQPAFSGVPFGHKNWKPSATPETEKSQKNTNDCTAPCLVIHGGSNHNSAYGDMWWFDFEDEKWSQLPLYVKNSKSKEKSIAYLPLVGHTILQLRDTFHFLGGLHQSDIDKLYKGGQAPPIKNEGIQCKVENTAAILDLSSMLLKGLIFNKANPNIFRQHLKVTATTAIYAQTHIWLIGGASMSTEDDCEQQLRGSISELVAPLAEGDIN